MVHRKVGDAGRTLVVEERLQGPEVSFFAIADGDRAIALASAQDHKRAFDDDRGPNTGGMGAFSPSPLLTRDLEARVMHEIVDPVIDAMKADGAPFRGFLYVGLMLTADGPKVIEFNVRLGDPEAQVLLPRLRVDLGRAADGGGLGRHPRRLPRRGQRSAARRRRARLGRLPGSRASRAGDHRLRSRRRRSTTSSSSTAARARTRIASSPPAGAWPRSSAAAPTSRPRSIAPTPASRRSSSRACTSGATSAARRSEAHRDSSHRARRRRPRRWSRWPSGCRARTQRRRRRPIGEAAARRGAPRRARRGRRAVRRALGAQLSGDAAGRRRRSRCDIGAPTGTTAPGRLTAASPAIRRRSSIASPLVLARQQPRRRHRRRRRRRRSTCALDLLGDRLSVGHGDVGATVIAGAFVAEPAGHVARLPAHARRRAGRSASSASAPTSAPPCCCRATSTTAPAIQRALPLAARARRRPPAERAASVAIIEARGLARAFTTKQGRVEAVCGVDFAVEPGEIVGFLGPNGAGKTTTLRMLTTLLQPTAGSATVVGCDLLADPAGRARAHRLRLAGRRHRSVVPGGRGADPAGRAARPVATPRRGAAPKRSTTTWTCARSRRGRPARCPAASAGGSTSRSGSSTGRRCCSSTSRAPASIRRAAATCGTWSARLRSEHEHHRLPDHALPRRSRRARRSAADHRPRPHRRRRHAGRAEAAHLRRRRDARDPRRRRARAAGDRRPSRASATSPAAARRCASPSTTASAPWSSWCGCSTRPGATLGVGQPGAADARRRVPHRHRPLAARRAAPAA